MEASATESALAVNGPAVFFSVDQATSACGTEVPQVPVTGSFLQALSERLAAHAAAGS